MRTGETQEDIPRPPAAPPRSQRRSWVGPIIWLLILVLLAGAGYRYYPQLRTLTLGLLSGPAPAAPRVVSAPVVTADARRGDLPVYLGGLGSVVPLNTVTIHTRVDGEIQKVSFTEGQIVHAGDPLVELDPRPFQVQLEQAQGQLAKDQASLDNARLDLARYEQAGEAATQQQRDTARAAVTMLEGALKSDQAAIDAANLQLTYCHITSPITGRIGLRLVDLGNIVHASDQTGLAVVTQLQPITVVFTLPEDSLPPVLGKINAGVTLPVQAFDRDLRNKLADGKLAAVDSQIDPTTGTVRLKAQFDNTDGALFPNQFVNARLLLDTQRNVVLIPAEAVQHSPQSDYVFVVTHEGKVATVDLRNIVIGLSENDQTVVASGLEPGEVVVIDGTDKLQQGSKVIPSSAAGQRAATRPAAATQPATTTQQGRTGHGHADHGSGDAAGAAGTAPAGTADHAPLSQ